MSNQKRVYNSALRLEKAKETKVKILAAANTLFATLGFEKVTIEKIAQTAEISTPTIYALFQSKLGILQALIDEALSSDHYEALVKECENEKTMKNRLLIAAKIARQMYDAERAQLDILRGASVLDPLLKKLEQERELRRYKRQEKSLQEMSKIEPLLVSLTKALDIIWAFTGRDLYRMLVIEQGWPPDEYEKWLGQLLIKTLIK